MKGYTVDRAFRKVWKGFCKEGGLEMAELLDDEKESKYTIPDHEQYETSSNNINDFDQKLE